MASNQETRLRILLTWAVSFILIMVAVWFLHETAHGFGNLLEGKHVSTGFNMVGASGKVPSDPDFSIDLPIEGLTIGLVLGPLSNWILAIVFTAILRRRTLPNRSSLLIGVAAIANAMMRFMPLTIFFVAAILGNTSGVWQDEQLMSLGAVERVELPISEAELDRLVDSEPSIFLGEIGFYFWALVSLGISLVCFILVYRHLFKLFHPQLQERWRKITFGLVPLILYFPVFGVVSMLDELVRINW